MANSLDNDVSGGFDNTIGGGTSLSGGNDSAGGSAYINGQSGQQGNFDAGLDGNNIYAGGSASDMTEGHAGASGQISQNVGPAGDAGASGSVDAYAKQGISADGSAQAGDHGVAGSGDAFAGTAAGVDGTGTIDTGIASTTASGGVSIGEQIGAGGGAEATYQDGKATIGVSGDVAAAVGLDVDAKETVDVSAAVDTGEAAAKAATDVAHDTEKAAKDTGKSVSKAANKTGKSIKKAFSDRRLKENVQLVETRAGINWYTFNYVWEKETKHIGVIAQELLESEYASAVETHPSGFYQVDYSKLA